MYQEVSRAVAIPYVWFAGDLQATEVSGVRTLPFSEVKTCRSVWTHPVKPETRAANVAKSSSLAITVLRRAKISALLLLAPNSPVIPHE